MEYLTAKQFSEKWGISERRIIKLCKENRIEGAVKNGMLWSIPSDTIKPADNRNKTSKYINTKKRVVVICKKNSELLSKLNFYLEKSGYLVDIIFAEVDNVEGKSVKTYKCNCNNVEEFEELISNMSKYYNALILIDLENYINKKASIIEKIANKMDCDSSIVLVSNVNVLNSKQELIENLKENIGVRINELVLTANIDKNTVVNYNSLIEDILALLTKFKGTTGVSITTNVEEIKFDEYEKTQLLKTGEFYKAINYYFSKLSKESYLWCASIMLADEWTEEPLEMQFRVSNLEAANRGVNIERIFIFSKSRIKEFKHNKTLQIYMQSSINTMFVDYDEVLKKSPELLKAVGDGWDGIDKDVLIVDNAKGEERGYISINKEEVNNAYNCFQELKKYAKNLKEILK